MYRKRFGQNFLQDKNIIKKIIAAIDPNENEHIVEIGPGLGALTKHLLPLVASLDVIELDRDLIPRLANNCRDLGELRIHQGDVLKFDFSTLAPSKHSLRIVGNLPYNISTPLLLHLLHQTDFIQDMHFMLQKEVAERIAAPSGIKNYGRLTVIVQYFCKVEILVQVPPTAFYPVPKVDSAVVRLVPHEKIALPAKNIANLEKLVKQAFSQRRKTLHNNLKGLITDEQLQQSGIDPQIRAERLEVADFVRLSNLLKS